MGSGLFSTFTVRSDGASRSCEGVKYSIGAGRKDYSYFPHLTATDNRPPHKGRGSLSGSGLSSRSYSLKDDIEGTLSIVRTASVRFI